MYTFLRVFHKKYYVFYFLYKYKATIFQKAYIQSVESTLPSNPLGFRKYTKANFKQHASAARKPVAHGFSVYAYFRIFGIRIRHNKRRSRYKIVRYGQNFI